jgi:hypothetical protein
MDNIIINNTFTKEEIHAIAIGLQMFMYENKYLSESDFNAAESALIKILEHV